MDLKWVILRPAQKYPRSHKEALPRKRTVQITALQCSNLEEKSPQPEYKKLCTLVYTILKSWPSGLFMDPYSLVCERLCLSLDGTFHNYDSFIISIMLSRWTMSCHPSASSPCSQASVKSIYGVKFRDRPHHIVQSKLCHATHLRHLLVVKHR